MCLQDVDYSDSSFSVIAPYHDSLKTEAGSACIIQNMICFGDGGSSLFQNADHFLPKYTASVTGNSDFN